VTVLVRTLSRGDAMQIGSVRAVFDGWDADTHLAQIHLQGDGQITTRYRGPARALPERLDLARDELVDLIVTYGRARFFLRREGAGAHTRIYVTADPHVGLHQITAPRS
jgi:hypothetical protein